MSLLLRRIVVLVVCSLVAAGCVGEPDIIEVSPGRAPATTSDEPITTVPPLVEPTPAIDEASTPTAEPVLDDATAVGIASDFVDQLRSGAASGDYSAAAEMWSGYPYGEEDRSSHLAALLTAHPWLLTGEVGFEALDSWAFEPQWAAPIVAITDPERASVATLLLDRTGIIQRIDQAATQTPRPVRIEGDVLIVDGVPIEGSALAYLDGVLLAEPVVDHEVFTTTFVLPPATGQREIFVASFATPEFPFSQAFVLDRN